MDLAQLDTRKAANEGRELVIVNPANGQETDIRILLAGADSDLFQKMNDDLQIEFREKLKKNPKANLSPQEDREKNYQRLARATLGWWGIQEEDTDGHLIDVPFSYEAAIRIYRNYPLVYRQALNFVGAETNFLPKPPESSPMPSEPS